MLAGLKALAGGSTPLCGARALPPGSARTVLGWLRDERRGVDHSPPSEATRAHSRTKALLRSGSEIDTSPPAGCCLGTLMCHADSDAGKVMSINILRSFVGRFRTQCGSWLGTLPLGTLHSYPIPSTPVRMQ